MWNEKLDLPVKIGEIADEQSYYQGIHGSALILSLFDGKNNLIARGMGASWNENYQLTPVMEWGKRHSVEIVKGAMPPGQININGLYFLDLNDTLPTYKNLVSKKELSAMIQIAEHEDESINGTILDVFQGIVIQGQSGNFNSQSLYLRNCNMIYRKRLKGIEWKELNTSAKYPAVPGAKITFNSNVTGDAYAGEIGS